MPPVKKVSKKVAKNVALRKNVRARANEAVSATETPAAPVKATKRVTKASKTAGEKKTRKAPTLSINFKQGTDMQTAWQEALKGGASRTEVSNRLAEMWADQQTRTGNPKPVSTILNHVVRRARANGYEVEQTWRLVKKDEASTDEVASADTNDTPKKPVKKKSVKKITKPGIKKTVRKSAR